MQKSIEELIKEEKRAYNRKWREKNKEHIAEYNKKWRAQNKEKLKKYEESYWRKKISSKEREN